MNVNTGSFLLGEPARAPSHSRKSLLVLPPPVEKRGKTEPKQPPFLLFNVIPTKNSRSPIYF